MASSQKKPPARVQSYPAIRVLTPQQHTFAAAVPNMIPRLAAAPSENPSSRLPSFPNLEIQRYSSYPNMPSIVSGPAGNTYTWLGPHHNVPPHHPGFVSSPTMYNNAAGVSSGMAAVNMASYKTNSQVASLTVLPRQTQGVPSSENTVQAVPSPPKPADKTLSRLPSNDVPRKAPLQGKSQAGISLPRNVSRKFPRPKQQRSTNHPETPTKAANSVQKRCQSPNDGCPGNSGQSPVVLPEISRATKRQRGDRDEESHDVEIVEVRKIGGDKTENRSNTAEIPISDKACKDEERMRASGPCRRPAKKRPTRATSPTQSSHRHRRPTYEYEVPLEVEGIRKALGPHNWDEYVYLLESLWLHKLTAQEFEQGTRPLFHIEYDTIRKKMNSMVVKKMIMPRLEEIRNSLPQHTSSAGRLDWGQSP